MSSSAANGSGSQGAAKTQSRVDRRRDWWTKNREFQRKLRDRSTLAKKENEQESQVTKVETARGFRSTMLTKLTPASNKSKKSLTTTTSNKKTSPQKIKLPRHAAKMDKAVKKKPKVVAKPSPTKQKVEKMEEETKAEMISEISMNAYGVDLTNAANHVPQRYILFIGNLPYTIDKGQLMSHFRKTGGVKSIRIPKDKTGKPKGFAYLEFKDRISHGIALRLHHTTLGGRRINVEISSSQTKKKDQEDS